MLSNCLNSGSVHQFSVGKIGRKSSIAIPYVTQLEVQGLINKLKPLYEYTIHREMHKIFCASKQMQMQCANLFTPSM
jgi:hypothetical protein